MTNEQVLALAGDWHGNRAWASARLQSLGARGITTVLHVGDFGIWPGSSGKSFLRMIDRTCERAGIAQILVTPGNHEDWGRLDLLWSNPKRHRHPLQLSDHVIVLPRGHRWEMEGRSFVSLGGAPSVDFEYRTRGADWWPEEMMDWADVERAAAPGYADVMITHDGPDLAYASPRTAQILMNNPQGWSNTALAYASVGRKRLNVAFLGVAPRLLVHGHYHVDDQRRVSLPGCDYETRIWSLAADGQAGNIRLLDLGTLDDPVWQR